MLILIASLLIVSVLFSWLTFREIEQVNANLRLLNRKQAQKRVEPEVVERTVQIAPLKIEAPSSLTVLNSANKGTNA